jgi:hypothetical protein
LAPQYSRPTAPTVGARSLRYVAGMKFRCANVFHCDADTYWKKLFFDQEYNEGLYKGALGFKNFEILEVTGEPGGDRTRKILTEPKTEAPAVVQKLIGGGVTYTETGRLDAKSGKFDYQIVTSKLSDKVKIKGRLWVEPRGDKEVERICDVDLEVSIFGVGGAIEKFIAEATRESYEKTAVYTNEFIAKKGY